MSMRVIQVKVPRIRSNPLINGPVDLKFIQFFLKQRDCKPFKTFNYSWCPHYIAPCFFQYHVTSLMVTLTQGEPLTSSTFRHIELSRQVLGQGQHSGGLSVKSVLMGKQLCMCWHLHTRQLLGYPSYVSQWAALLWCMVLDGDLWHIHQARWGLLLILQAPVWN